MTTNSSTPVSVISAIDAVGVATANNGDHSLRRFDRMLDLGFIREFTEKFYCSDNGRPSVDPELFMRMVLLSHIYGITSDSSPESELSLTAHRSP